MKSGLQKRLVEYLRKYPNRRFAKGYLADLARAKMGVTGETVGRRLRVLAEVSQWGYRPTDTPEHRTAHELLGDDKIMVEQIGGHSHYWYEPSKKKTVRRVQIIDGVAHEIYEEVTNEEYADKK